MPAQHRALEVVWVTRWLIAVALVGCTTVLAQRPDHTAGTGPGSTSEPGRVAATDCARTLPADGQGGYHAIVAIQSTCQETVSSLVEHYGLAIAGAPWRGATMVLMDSRAWRTGDRFLAQLRPARVEHHASAMPASADTACDAREDERLDVVGLLPLDPEDTRTVAQITATKPDLWSPSDDRWRSRPPERERWAAVVTTDRRWRVHSVDLRRAPVDLARLGPVPVTAKVGSVYFFVGSPDTAMRPLRSTRDDGTPPGPIVLSPGIMGCD